ncbi:hypothetical protein CERSUDRAFT_115467 [Gelatoporia subvermispora B]|uniref:Protein kinase domain-containing protein n=1 Tax=Ceriporiopsis subvermispora (strain B) TaxID=914234 RepID=M2RDE9_CERS8|nr:hypothetical protein CERSUDRAFT_115467 [Gelatoporia subvermispora B]
MSEQDAILDRVAELAPPPEVLLSREVWWRDHQSWLKEHGYLLRPRYAPDWVPSWKGTDKYPMDCEDNVASLGGRVLDATRVSDGTMVLLKKTSVSDHPHEIEIGKYFSSEPLASDPRNHCVRLDEVLDVPDDPDLKVLVMPLLRPLDDPRFQTVGEAVEFLRQIFEGLQFMHEHAVVHRDCMGLNIMMDPRPLFPKMFHPRDRHMNREWTGRAKYYSRTKRPTKYLFIDFGISKRYSTQDLPILEPPHWGGDRTVPEYQNSQEPRDPFPVDVYYIGNMIREYFFQRFRNLEFMKPLVDDMVQDEPSKRPTIREVSVRFDSVRQKLSNWKLRSRLKELDEDMFTAFFRSTGHCIRMAYYVTTRHPAIPTPKP